VASAETSDIYTTNEDRLLNVVAPGVISNDYDPDDGDTENLTTYAFTGEIVPFSGTSNAGAGIVIYDDGSFTYDPTISAQLNALKAGEYVGECLHYSRWCE